MTVTYDMSVVEVDTEAEEVTSLGDPGSGPALITGIVKLAQRWMLEFLTVRGSLVGLPTRGCSFLQAAAAGSLTTETDVFQQFLLASAEIETNLRSDESDTDEEDERYAGCLLQAFSLSNGRMTLTVLISSAAGASRVIQIPIAIA